MKYGTKMHYLLETSSFNNSKEEIVNNLLNSLDINSFKGSAKWTIVFNSFSLLITSYNTQSL